MDKIKKFFKDHEDEIAIATFVAGVSAMVIGFALLKEEQKNRITGVYSRDDVPSGSQIFVVFANGESQSFTKP